MLAAATSQSYVCTASLVREFDSRGRIVLLRCDPRIVSQQSVEADEFVPRLLIFSLRYHCMLKWQILHSLVNLRVLVPVPWHQYHLVLRNQCGNSIRLIHV